MVRSILFIITTCLIIAGCAGNDVLSDGKKQDALVVLSGQMEGDVRVVNVKAFQYGFDPDPIVVKKGDRVRLSMTSLDVEHGIGIPAFNIQMYPGPTATQEFVADKTGTYPLLCIVACGSGHNQMRGSLIVTG